MAIQRSNSNKGLSSNALGISNFTGLRVSPQASAPRSTFNAGSSSYVAPRSFNAGRGVVQTPQLPQGRTALISQQQALSAAQGAQRNSNRSLGRASGAAGALRGTAGRTAGIGSNLYSIFSDSFAPLLAQLPGLAQQPIGPVVDRAAADVSSAFDRSRGITNQNLSRFGINPSSGRYRAQIQDLGRAEAAARAGAQTSARERAQNANFARMAELGRLGLSTSGQALNAYGSAGSQYGNASQLYSGIANQYGGQAAQAGALAGYQQGLQAPQVPQIPAGQQGQAAPGGAWTTAQF